MRSSLQPIFQYWLKLQCQMSNNSPQGLLVHYEEGKKPKVEARVSLSSTIHPVVMDDKHMIETAKKVLEKKRLHLFKMDDDLVYLGYPVVINDVFWGAVVVQVEGCDTTAMHSMIKLLQWGTTWLQFIIHSKTNQLVENKHFESGDQSQVFSLMMSALKEKTLTEAAISTVNFIAAQFNLERVSLGLCYSKRVSLAAVSFSATFDAKSESMRHIVGVMEEAVEQKTNISADQKATAYPRDSKGVMTRAHVDTLNKHHLKSIHSYLLRTQDDIIGVITVENVKGDDISAETKQFIDNCLSMLAAIYHIKKASSKGVLRLIKENVSYWLTRVFGFGHWYAKIFAIVGVLLVASFFIPAKFYISNDAVLDSINKHLLVSPYEGFIKDIYAQPGDVVEKGQALAQLKDDDLALEKRRLVGHIHQLKIEYDNSLANSSRVQAAILEAQIVQSQVELELADKKLDRVRLTSPIDGVIVSDDVRQSIGAPVKQGDVLFEIADRGKYRVTLYVDERNVIHFRTGQKGRVSLTSLPDKKIDITIERITPISEVKNSRNYFRVDAVIDNIELLSSFTSLRPGMTGSAKIHIDERKLSWIWFHEIWYWLRLALWI